MRKWLLVFTLLVFLGLTSGFNASMQSLDRHATPEKPALFQITIENTESTAQRFTLSHQFTKSGWIYFDSSKTIPAGETGKINVTIDPGEDSLQQSYSFTMFVSKFSSDESVTLSDYMNVQREYELNIKNFEVSKTSFRPGETLKGEITVQNLAPRIISGYEFNSNFMNQSETKEGIAIAPAALKTYSFSHNIPETAPPGQENFSVKLNYSGVAQLRHANITVEEIKNVTKTFSEEDKVLYRKGSLIAENFGNSNVSLSENMTFPSYLQAILSFNPKPDSLVQGSEGLVYTWDFSLEPGEKKTIKYSVDYWMPLTLAGVILLGILILRKITGNVDITKKVEESEQGELTVSITLKNNSDQLRTDLKVKDFVPNVAQLDEDFHMTKPELKRTTDGVKLEWGLEDFKPGEQRIIQYKLNPKVEIEGGLDLPSAKVAKEDRVINRSSGN